MSARLDQARPNMALRVARMEIQGVWAVLSVVTGVFSALMLGVLLGPLAVVFGALALSRRHLIGWVGVVLGLSGIYGTIAQLSELGAA